MLFISKGNNGMEIQFEETDTDNEKRMVEQGLAFIKNTIQAIRDVETYALPNA